jgi:hypothetical protein
MAAMAYDTELRSEVLFGGGLFINGTSQTIFYNQTWVYSPQGIWYQLNTLNSPPPRAGGVMEYISQPYNEMVLFGGINETAAFDDTWVLNMTTDSWTNTTAAGVHPSSRGIPMAAPLRGQNGFIIFGGANATGGVPSLVTTTKYSNDMWEYTPTGLWKNITGLVSPSPRAGGSFAYSGSGSNYVLFGGVTDSSHLPLLLTDTWLYDSSSGKWSQQNTTAGSTSSFAGCTVYDPLTSEVLYMGGYGYLGSGNSTWRWSTLSSGWGQAASMPTMQQPTIAGTECAYDPALNGTIVFGGTNAPQLGGNDFRDYDTTYLVRDTGWSLTYVTSGPVVSGSPFELFARAVNEWGLTVDTNVSLVLTDSTGTINPATLALGYGYGEATVVILKPLSPDGVSACLYGVCASISLPVLADAKSIAIMPFSTLIQAGRVINITLDVKDSTGGYADWWNGTANLTVLPGRNITPVTITYGVGTSQMKPTMVGNYTLVAFSGALAGSQCNFTVTPGALSNLSVATSFSDVRVRGTQNVSITALDAYGNRVMLQRVNISDILGDVAPGNFSMRGGVAIISLHIGNASGTDIIHAIAEGVSGVSSSFYVSPAQVTTSPPPPSSSSPFNSLLLSVIIVVAAAVIIALIVFRKVIFRRKDDPKPVAYLGLLPFKEDTKEKHHEEHRHRPK